MTPELNYYLRRDVVHSALAAQHTPHAVAAKMLGVSVSHWSRVFNGRVPVSTSLRWRIANSPLFAGVPDVRLWELR